MSEFRYLTTDDLPKTIQSSVNKKVKDYLIRNVYKDIFQDVDKLKSNRRSDDPLKNAFLTGKIYYIDSIHIKGEFSFEVIKALIALNAFRVNDSYLLPKSLLPDGIKQHIFYHSSDKIVNDFTSKIQQGAIALLLNSVFLTKEDKQIFQDKYLFAIDKKINSKIQTNIQYDQYTQNYINQLDFKIKGFLEEDIKILRNKLVQKFEEGASLTEVKQFLRNEYQLNNNRCKRISEGETRIFLNQYQDNKFISIGKTKYKWFHPDPKGETSRKGHVELFKRSQAGEIFDLLNDPIDPITGKPTRPAKEYGCRCLKIIIL